jgi:hypothetical protein
MMFVYLLGCAPGGPVQEKDASGSDSPDSAHRDSGTDDSSASRDSAARDTSRADTADTGGDPSPCGETPDPNRDVTFSGLFGRLATQGCLHDADQELLLELVDAFYEHDPVWCDAVWRVRSEDGLVFAELPERVREHASVPDVWIDASGAHTVVYNDLSPDLFARTLRDEPAEFWRRGLVGVGGLGAMTDTGDGFAEVSLDLALPDLAVVVDPDLAQTADGDWRVVTFHVVWTEFDGVAWDPYGTEPPHEFHRAAGRALESLGDSLVVAGEMGPRGGADPTVLDLSGEEILFVGDFFSPMEGWRAPGGVYASADAPPDIHTGIAGAAPDAIADPAGGYRLYFRDPVGTELRLATSEDGSTWTIAGDVDIDVGELNNPAVARDPGGDWWLYFSQRDEDCQRAVDAERALAGAPPVPR